MARINLVPKEILERRKYERFYPWVAIGAVVLIVGILLVYATFLIQIGSRNRQLQQDEQTAQQLQAQADAFAVFEQKEQELGARMDIADLALKGRVAWGKLFEEVSLVMPEEMWADSLNGEQDTANGPFSQSGEYQGMGATFTVRGQTPDADEGSLDEGYKSVAKAMVRLNDLKALTSVWLTEATIGEYPSAAEADTIPVTTLLYAITSGVVVPDSTLPPNPAAADQQQQQGTAAAPAPPGTTGQ